MCDTCGCASKKEGAEEKKVCEKCGKEPCECKKTCEKCNQEE